MSKSGYDAIAQFYDAVIGRSGEWSDQIERIIRKNCRNAKSILELGCGTGTLLEKLSNKYYVEGIDSSSEMLKIARRKIPGVKLRKTDIRDFKSRRKFDVILCLYDTVNHLTSFREWRSLFSNVSRHLNPEGIFLFDVNTDSKLLKMTRQSPFRTEFDSSYLMINVTRESKNVFNWNLKILEKKKAYRYILHESNIRESAFAVSKIRTSLERQFAAVKMINDFSRNGDQSDRIYFVCKKD